MTKRIFRSIFSVALVVLAASLVLTIGALYTYFSDLYNEQIRSECRYIAGALEQLDDAYLDELDAGVHRITWVAADGAVLYDNSVDASNLENHAGRQEIAEAIATGTGESTRYSDTMAEKSYYYAIRLSDGSVLRTSASQYTPWMLALTMGGQIILILLAALVLSLLLASSVARSITKPINAIDPEHPEQAVTYEELTPLLQRMSRQKQQIQAQMDTLAHKQQEFATITENMSEGLLVIDQNAELLSYNSGALRLLGAETAREGAHVLTLNRSEPFRAAVENALAGRHSEAPLRMGSRTYQLIANSVFQNGRTVGAVLMILDVTEREERDRLRREFTANVSHELKTPLTSISGFAEIMQNGMAREEDMRRFAGNIYAETQRLITLVGDIIRLSQLDEGEDPHGKMDVDLSGIAATVAQRLQDGAERQQVTLHCSGTTATVHGNARILDEIIYNLCDNAIKYNRPGGSVTIHTAVENGRAVLTVSDTGIGIPYRDQNRVFERFYRVDKSHSRQIGGTGLGLSIVKHGAAYHNAQIKLVSVPDKGTSISLLF